MQSTIHQRIQRNSTRKIDRACSVHIRLDVSDNFSNSFVIRMLSMDCLCLSVFSRKCCDLVKPVKLSESAPHKDAVAVKVGQRVLRHSWPGLGLPNVSQQHLWCRGKTSMTLSATCVSFLSSDSFSTDRPTPRFSALSFKLHQLLYIFCSDVFRIVAPTTKVRRKTPCSRETEHRTTRDWVAKCLGQMTDTNRTEAQAELRQVIADAFTAHTLWTTDWAGVQLQRFCAMSCPSTPH